MTIVFETCNVPFHTSFDTNGKISSDIEHLILSLRQTPKVIGIFKEIQPQTVLVGFKLLDGVAKEMLIDTAYQLLVKNKCDFVLANDSRTLKDGGQIGYLISENKKCVRLDGKAVIAHEIVRVVMKKINEAQK